MYHLRLSFLLPFALSLTMGALGRVVELPELDDKGLPTPDEGGTRLKAPSLDELTVMDFWEKVGSGYW